MLSKKDIIALGMMIFALFLGAGNIIFPPMEGYQAGSNWFWAALGFVLTGVFMPFVTLIVVTIKGKGEALSVDLPKWAQVAFWATLYLVIGSTFAMPRVTNVAYEMGWMPLNIVDANHPYAHFIFAFVFNLIGLFFMLRKNTIISTVGKIMTPALLVLLVIVALQVVQTPLSDIPLPTKAYATESALTVGMVGGYQTMDVLAATAFGGIVAHIMLSKKVTDAKRIIKYTLIAGSLSVVLLSLLYFSLFYLGATSQAVAQDATNGGQIFSRYVGELFGTKGVWIMSGIVMLANLTTLVGVTSASADYFSRLSKVSYPFWVVLFCLLTTIISETGLTTLLRVTIPALLLIYPVAIMLVVLQLIRHKLPLVKLSYNLSIGVTVLFSAIDSLNNLGWIPDSLNQVLAKLPFYSAQLAWLIPALIALVMSIVLGKARK
ncbi:branched-chain amino acid transport system II carrier protein [Pasteurellaceae bacterium RH1A]|nr:branched-chain amino acid transport system II carrier protein [Pasteurellaceae bacterium RH1A]